MADDEFRSKVIESLAGVWLELEIEEQVYCYQIHGEAIFHPATHTIRRRTKARIVGPTVVEDEENLWPAPAPAATARILPA
jgi:hypothetical protein